MTKYAAIAILVLRLVFHPSNMQAQTASVQTPSITLAAKTDQPKISGIKAGISNNKVVLNWIVDENSMTSQFEIEKSTDGTHFVLAALVFGSEEQREAHYEFYEKAVKQKVVYRIKLIGKNKETEYSGPIEVQPGA